MGQARARDVITTEEGAIVDERLSKYHILSPLGRGTSSFVYKATLRSETKYYVSLVGGYKPGKGVCWL